MSVYMKVAKDKNFVFKIWSAPFKKIRFIRGWISKSVWWDQGLGEVVRYGSCNITRNYVFWDDIPGNIVTKVSGMTSMSTRFNDIWQVTHNFLDDDDEYYY